MKKIFFLFFIQLFCLNLANAQAPRFSEKPEEFLKSVQDVMAATQNPSAGLAAKNLETIWASGKLTDAQKVKIVAITAFMQKKGYKPLPFFGYLFDDVHQAVNSQNITAAGMDSFLNTLQKTVELNDTKTVQKLLEVANAYFANRQIYRATFNRLYLFGGSFNFKYNEQVTSPNAPAVVVAATPTPAGEAPKPAAVFDAWDAPSTPILSSSDQSQNSQAPVIEQIPQTLAAGPAIEFKNVSLTIASANDSVTLINTGCTVGIKDGILLGNGGNFTWDVAGNPEIFASLGNYRMDVRNPKLACDDATLTYGSKLNAPVKGIFEYQSKKRGKNVVTTYPRFMSFDNNIPLKNLNTPDLEYRGGFALAGKRVYSSSVNSKYTTLIGKKDGKIAFKAVSKRFELGDSLLTAPSTSFTGYLGADSLYHPAVKFFYDKRQNYVRLTKIDEGGFRDATYSDSYHKLFILADQMRWVLSENKMDFYILAGKNVVPALFESFDYFNPERFQNIPGQYSFNPLLVLANYCRTRNITVANVYDLAVAYKQSPDNFKSAMLTMMQQGYVDYDPDIETLRLSKKGIHYLNANAGKKDYDNFIIPSYHQAASKDSAANATLSLKDNILIIRGVKQCYLSDSLNAYLAPYDRTVRVTKDRNVAISGEVKTGNFRFRGKDLTFNYNDFSIKFNKIDSITFVPQKELAKGGRTEIGGDLRYESGVLYINKPDNKSGKVKLPEFPRLVVPNGVTAYFDQPYRANGAYNRKVFFKVPSIDFDSLNVKDIDFVGSFTSDGIFPTFPETLISMPDNSLGFSHIAPNGKYNLYNGNTSAKFNAPLMMDKKGLHSEAELDHLTAAIKAKEAFFTPDSVTAVGTSGEIKEGTVGQSYFTKVDIKNFSLKWKPKVDSMVIVSKGNSFDFYGASSRLEGRLIVRQTGLFGLGTVRRNDSEIASERFKFGKEQFTATTAEIKVGENLKNTKPQLLSKDVDVNFDIAKGLVSIQIPLTFHPSDSTSLFFPFAGYRTNINKAEWRINDKKISMKGDLSKTVFTATEASQEGLAFNGMEAVYEIDKNNLNVTGVPFIKSADAKIIPYKGEVSIRRDAEMRPLYKARIQIDTLNGYHNLTDGNIRVFSAKRFEGDATYQFVSSMGDTTNIKMGNFELVEKVDLKDPSKKKAKSYYTIAKAILEDKDKFHISPQLLYKGSIVMDATEKSLILDGFIRPEIKSRFDIGNYWIPFKGKNTDEVHLTVDANMKGELVSISTGLHFRRANGGLYNTFLSAKENPKDEDIFTASGLLTDNSKKKLLDITTADKAAERSYEGSRYIFNDAKKLVTLEGRFNIFPTTDLVETAGFAQCRLDSAKFAFDVMTVFNFELPPQAVTAMGDRIVKTHLNERTNLKSADEKEDKEELFSKLAQLYGHKPVEAFRQRAMTDHVPLYSMFPKLNTTLVLTKVDLRWSPEANAFYSVGKLGVSNIGTTDINTEMDGALEIRKTPEGDDFYLYLEASPEVWYYFGFLKNQMGILSSDSEFFNAVTAKAKTIKAKSYSITAAEPTEKELFLDRYQQYLPKADRKSKQKIVSKKEDPKKEKKKEEEKKEGF